MSERENALRGIARRTAAAQDDSGGGMLARIARRAVLARLAGLRHGRLRISEASGQTDCGEPSPPPGRDVHLRISDPSAWVDIAQGGTIGAAEAYMAGKWSACDLTALVRLIVANRAVMEGLESGAAALAQPLQKLVHWLHRNTRRGSARNIHAHYDLGNALFELFLDPTMMYSAAVYPREDATLEEASVHKLDLICRKLELAPQDHLLEIGTGWGGLAMHAARHYGCRVTTTTISREQFAFATQRIAAAGLSTRVTVQNRDYRDLTGCYDKLVSVEMIEAVGHRYLDTYFRVCSERLKPAGRMLLQSILIADRHYAQARRSVDFIQKYIFPGGALPSMGSISAALARHTDLQMVDLQDIGLDYARTLKDWRARFMARVADVRRLGYPDEFIRMWEWYLAYCEGGFRERSISTVQLVFDKPGFRPRPA